MDRGRQHRQIDRLRNSMKGVNFLSVICVGVSFVVHAAAIDLSPRVRPVIGILTMPAATDDVNISVISMSYVRWLEGAGAVVTPIFFNDTLSNIEDTFYELSGVLFTGGPNKPTDYPRYLDAAGLILNLSLRTGMPLWGTCLGFQTISDLSAGGIDVLSDYDAYNMELPLKLTPAADTSKLFSNMPDDILRLFTEESYTTNWHHYGVSPEIFQARVAPAGMKALSVNADKDGLLFVSTMEHETAAIYATQYHPEANAHDLDHQTVNHCSDAIRAMQYFSSFFVEECRSKGLGHGDANANAYIDIETFPIKQGKYIFQ